MDNKYLELAEDLIDFIDRSPVSFYAAENIKHELESVGYSRLDEGEKWILSHGGKYFVERNRSSIIAFQIGETLPWESGFKIVGAHTDSPLLKLKNDSLSKSAGCATVNIEAYGGGISSTWLDRDLSLAGRVTINTENGVDSQFVDFKRAIGTIPNLSIHLNRDVNKGFEYNKQNHLSVLLFGNDEDVNDKITIYDIVGKELGIKPDTILDMDLYFYDIQGGELVGVNRDIISVGRLDNLAMCHSIYSALKTNAVTQGTNVGVFFDNEEIGSRTLMGADSNYLNAILDRIVHSLGGNLEDNLRARHKSFLVSADGAHAHHPNFKDKHDSSYAPLINRGPVVKMSANFRYATTSESAGFFINLCKKAEVPFQKMVNRSDIPSGSTIGPMSSASLGIETVDVGNAMFAMHSIRESQGVKDHFYMTKVIKEFYQS